MRTIGILLVLVCATTVSACGQAAEGNAAAAIRALEHEWVEGQTRNDNGALDLIFDNALVYVEYGRLVTKGEYLSRIRQAGPQVSQIALEPMALRQEGKTVIVTGTYREKMRAGGQSRPKRWRFIDTWVYKQNRWMLVSAAAAPVAN